MYLKFHVPHHIVHVLIPPVCGVVAHNWFIQCSCMHGAFNFDGLMAGSHHEQKPGSGVKRKREDEDAQGPGKYSSCVWCSSGCVFGLAAVD